ncbi:unnamed protein product [Brachionus calyciflorus]|uniref:AAA+ ATPase domain-containing protein n=1 Tax=Brachionus calyciflorus TaxID=104777 RepID=A0A813MEH6_9BILA|nr:unnamed protein product [Brachionus calyciflorus]
MLAKLGITSPFNKRKIKEINETKQLLQQQQQQNAHQQATSQKNVSSNIPAPKKIPQSNLPVFHSNIYRNSNLISSTDSSSFGFNNSKKSYNSSRSGSPTTSIAESNCTTTSTTQLNKQSNSKLPQFQMNSPSNNSLSKDKRKSGLIKPSKPSIPQPTQSNVPQNNFQQNQPTNSSKLQQLTSKPQTMSSLNSNTNNLNNKQLNSNSDKQKKLVSSIQNQNLQSQSQAQMPALANNTLNSSKLNLSQVQSKKTTSTTTFGLQKLTKLNSKQAEPEIVESKSQNVNSKIPGSLIGLKPGLKSPSIQLNSNSPLKLPVNSKLVTNTSNSQVLKTPLKQLTVTPIKRQSNIPNKSKISLASFQNSQETNIARVTPFSENSKIEDKSHSDEKQEQSDLEDEILGIADDLNEETVNEEEFQKFLNSDLDDEKIDLTCNKNETTNNNNNNNKHENLSIKINENNFSSELSPPLPSPPSSILKSVTTSSVTNSINQIKMPVNSASINLNSFGRSNTLDRKLKNQNESSSSSINKYKINNSYIQVQHQQQQISFQNDELHMKDQRNSLNIQLKSPSSNSYRINNINNCNTTPSKRPLSQEPIMEITTEIHLDENDNFTNNLNSSIFSFNPSGTMSKMQQVSYELENAKNRILSLTNQLNSNAQLVYTLEQTISAISLKLQNETKNSQRKDTLINELKAYIDYIQNKYPKVFENEKAPKTIVLNRQNSNESLNSLNSMFSQRSYQSSSSAHPDGHDTFSKKKKSWLRSSFNKAFRKNVNKNENKNCLSDVEEKDFVAYGDFSLPNSPLHHQIINSKNEQNFKVNEDSEEYQRLLRDKEIKLTDIRLEALATAHQLDQTKEENLKMKIEIENLRNENLRMQQLLSQNQHSQILPHTPISVSSPSPSSSVISSSSNNSKMNLSLSNSSQNVENLIFNHTSTSSTSSVSLLKSPISNSVCLTDIPINEGKRVLVSIYIGNLENPLNDLKDDEFNGQILIGNINLTTRTKWDTLDSMIKKMFIDYLNKLEANSIESGGLGLNLDSINFYIVGDVFRKPFDTDQKTPDLLPYGYLVGNYTNIVLKLKDASENSIDSLCYDCLVPKHVMLRYISIVLEFKNLLFCGPSGTCKTYIARKIGEYLIKKEKCDLNESIIYLNVENKSINDLRIYLNNLESTETNPLVLILDNLHAINNIHEAFSDYFCRIQTKLIYIIGTINQPNVTALNLHPNFKWVLFVNHTEPVKNYLTRTLERRLVDQMTKLNNQNFGQLEVLIDWIPKLWTHVNMYIESYNSVDLCIGPKDFSTFPLDFKKSSEWFIDFWNQNLVPIIIDTVKEGVLVYGQKNDWEDPKKWLTKTLPWLSYDHTILNRLQSINSQQVGFEHDLDMEDSNFKECLIDNIQNDRRFCSYPNTPSKMMSRNSHDNDKLLNMLMKLQEATGIGGQQNFLHLESSSNDLIQNVKNLSLLNTNGILKKNNPIES